MQDPAIIVRQTEALQGYCFGFRQRCILAAIEMDSAADYDGFEQRVGEVAELAALLEMSASVPLQEDMPAEVRSVLLLGQLTRNLQVKAGFPVHDDPKIVRRETSTGAQGAARSKYLLALSAQSLDAAGGCFRFFVDLANQLIGNPSASALTEAQRQQYEELASQLERTAKSRGILFDFVEAALPLGIPFQLLTPDTMQLGWASRSRMLLGTSTDRTPMVGVHIARSKVVASSILRSCGVPVPLNAPVSSEDMAVKAAGEIGYPVVVKPADRDGGAGASANLRTEDHVRQAYRRASRESSSVMVEKHVSGTEYRLMVVNGELFWAFERTAAHVVGDGASTIRELIDRINVARAENPPTRGVSQMIHIDDEIEEVLGRLELTLDSIPPAGEEVRLRTTPLSATGGAIRAAFDDVHPDNAELAVRAARLLRLDIAGVDLLTPDIRTSWRENGGHITEVNAGPQIGSATRSDMFTAVLRELLKGDGRIPVAVVIGSQTGALAEELRARTRGRSSRVGIASDERITIGSAIVHEGRANPSVVARMFTSDPGVDAAVWFTSGESVVTNGLPFDSIDLLVLAEDQSPGLNQVQLLSVIKDNVREVLLQGGPAQASTLARMTGATVSHGNTGAQVVRKLLSILTKDRK
jgi:cyanophycin synthetase